MRKVEGDGREKLDEALAKAALMRFQAGAFLDEGWLLRLAGATIELLDEMVMNGWLVKNVRICLIYVR